MCNILNMRRSESHHGLPKVVETLSKEFESLLGKAPSLEGLVKDIGAQDFFRYVEVGEDSRNGRVSHFDVKNFIAHDIEKNTAAKFFMGHYREREYLAGKQIELFSILNNIQWEKDTEDLVAIFTEANPTRSEKLWRWARHAIEVSTLSTVPERNQNRAIQCKLWLAMMLTMLDDFANTYHNQQTFNEGWDSVKNVDTSNSSSVMVNAVSKIHAALWQELRRLPNFDRYEEQLAKDLEIVRNGQQYCLNLLTQKEKAENYSREKVVDSFFMHLFTDIDLMASEKFDEKEFNKLREAVDHAQWIWAMINWMTTWEREISGGDFTGGILGEALRAGNITKEEITSGNIGVATQKINKLGLRGEMETDLILRSIELRKLLMSLKSISGTGYFNGILRIVEMHVLSEGII